MADADEAPSNKKPRTSDALLDDFLSELDAPPPPPPPPPPGGASAKPKPHLYFDVFKEGALAGCLNLSGASQLTFGRDADRVDVPLEHDSISRHHATMTFDGDVAYVSDIRSTHGTFVAAPGTAGEDGFAKIGELTRLDPGARVRFGGSSRVYVFGVGEGAAPAPPPRAVSAALQDIAVAIAVPAEAVGRLTGRGGLAMEEVMVRSGAKVVLLPPDEATAEGRAGARVLRVSGSVEAVSIARSDLVPMTKTFEPAATSVGDFRGRFRYASTLDGIDDDDPPVKGVY